MPGGSDHLHKRIHRGGERVRIDTTRLEGDEGAGRELHLRLDDVIGGDAHFDEHLLAAPGAGLYGFTIEPPAHEIDIVRGKKPCRRGGAGPADVLCGDVDRIVLARVSGERGAYLARSDGFTGLLLGRQPSMVEPDRI